MRAATRKRTDEHKQEMAFRAQRRQHRSERRLRMVAKREKAQEAAQKLREHYAQLAAQASTD